METENISIISKELGISRKQIQSAAALLAEEATVPFIARYRKEATGGLDEAAIIAIRDRLLELEELDKRKEAIIKSLKEQDKLTPELEHAVMTAETMAKLEDIYLPYRPRRRTRGMIAKEKGLEPLAEKIFSQGDFDPRKEALAFVSADKGVASMEEALDGARDIMAEWINENANARESMRELFRKRGFLSSKLIKSKEKEAVKYRDYFELSEPVSQAPSHRILAVLRGAEEGFLTEHFMPEEEIAAELLDRQFRKGNNAASEQVALAVIDGYRRLMGPSMETELRGVCKKRADDEAIKVFAENLRVLLLASPLGEKAILGLDPGFRTGCKLVCLSRQGSLVHNETIYPLEPQNKTNESAARIKDLCGKYRIEAIAIGNGTGGREALSFCKGIGLANVIITMVNESGASVYSASEIARKEFPEHDITVRGAVSIGRRLMDPLAELVKIDPKAIGVGQYQHDVDQKSLKKSLEDTVKSCVNAVGVEVNTASGELLSYVSGLSPRMADAIVKYRTMSGPFSSREDLRKVPGMGPRTFEQAAGFLRIRNAENPLDSSAVHPEAYHIVEEMARDLSCNVIDLMKESKLRDKIDLKKYMTPDVGMPTLTDIHQELARPGRDPRKEFELFNFSENVHAMADLKPGMSLPGVVTNVTAFGAFVDIGVHQDGLVHISNLADNYVSDPHAVVKAQQKVTVTVLEVDVERKRIALSMKSQATEGRKKPVTAKKTEDAKGKSRNTASAPKKPAEKKAVQEKPVTGARPFSGLKDILK